MKKSRVFLIVGLVVVICFAIGGKLYMNKEQEKEEKEIIEMEKVIVKQIKNTFEDVKKVKFESVIYNKKAGFRSFETSITTSNGTRSTGGISYEPDEQKILTYGPISKDFRDIIKYGETIDLIDVVFSDSSKGEL